MGPTSAEKRKKTENETDELLACTIPAVCILLKPFQMKT